MDVSIISSYPTSGCGISKYTEELINGLKHNHINVQHYRLFFLREKVRSSICLIIIFYEIIKSKPQIVHIQYTPSICGPVIVPFLCFIKFFHPTISIVITVHEMTEGYFKHLKIKILKKAFIFYEKSIFNFTDLIFVHTNIHKQKMIYRYKKNTEKIRVISHGVGIEKQVTDNLIYELEESYNIKNKSIITFFGTIRPNKGIEYLILAFSKIIQKEKEHHLILLIAGFPPKKWEKYFNKLKNLIEELEINDYIRFTGFVKDETIPIIFQLSDIIVLPYIQITQSGVLYREIIPYEKPVIVSDVGGIAETVKKNKIGIIIPPKDIKSLTSAILELMTNEKKKELIVKNMSDLKKRLSWNNIAKRHIGEYQLITKF